MSRDILIKQELRACYVGDKKHCFTVGFLSVR